MKITVNNNVFTEAGWSVYKEIGTLDLYTEASLTEIITMLGNHPIISVYDDNDELLSMWSTSSVKSISEEYIRERRRITVQVDATILTDNAEEVINTNIDNSIDSILELAEIIDEMDTTIENNTNSIERINTDLESLNTQVFNLQSTVNNIPANLNTQLNTIVQTCNSLADRIANLENRLT